MKNATEKVQSIPRTALSVMKDKCLELSCLKPLTGFPLALNFQSKPNMAYRVLQDLASPYLSVSFVD